MSAPRSRTAFIVGAAANWLAFAATLAVAFVLTPFLVRTLGTARYGVWCVVESVLAYFTLLDMGVAACLVRFVARHRADPDRTDLNRIASSCLAVFLAASGVALALGVPVLFALSGGLTEKAGDADVLPFMLLMLLNLAATLPLGVFPSLLDGLERYTAKSVIKLVVLGLRTGGMAWAVTAFDRPLLPLAGVYLASTVVEHAAAAAIAFRLLPGLRFARRFVDRATLKEVKTYSVNAFLAMLAGRVTVQTGNVIIGVMMPIQSVAFYANAARLVEYAKTLLRTVTATLTPNVAAMEARGDRAGIVRLFLNATRWVLYLAAPVNVGLVLFGRPFLARWLGPEFADGAYPAAVVLSLTLSVGVAQSVASRMLYGLGKLTWFARAALVEAAVNVLLTVALIGPFGVTGVAVAVAVPNVLFCLFVTALAGREIGATLGQYVRACAPPLLLALLPAAVWLTMGEPTPDYAAIATRVLAGLVPFAAAVGGWELAPRLWRKWSKVGMTIHHRVTEGTEKSGK